MQTETHPKPRSAAIIGLGSVGSGWAALNLAHEINVRAHDPGEGAFEISKELITQSWPSLRKLGITSQPKPNLEHLAFFEKISETVAGADLVIENVPENIDLKKDVIAQIDAAASSDALILSSAGGISASQLQSVCHHPQRVLVMHPFNPSHLIPLVEVVPGEKTSAEATERALSFARSIGKQPITLKRELNGHMVNRLQFALVRESIRCLMEGVASAADIDAAVRYGLAPRWLLMGGMQTVAMAGGPGGMRGILDHAGPAMEKWWATEAEFSLTTEIKDQLVEAAKTLSDGGDFADWVHWRDEQLVTLLATQANADAKRPQT